jgi:hypothetical protein
LRTIAAARQNEINETITEVATITVDWVPELEVISECSICLDLAFHLHEIKTGGKIVRRSISENVADDRSGTQESPTFDDRRVTRLSIRSPTRLADGLGLEVSYRIT